MTNFSRRTTLALLGTAITLPTLASGGEPVYLDGQGLALRGYDPVAYFDQDAAVRGQFDHEAVWEKAAWRFVSAYNRELFLKSPAKYAPQYGGYCADGIARGFKRVSDPEVWVIVNDKLYVHYTVRDQNAWAADIAGNIRMANANWRNLRDL